MQYTNIENSHQTSSSVVVVRCFSSFVVRRSSFVVRRSSFVVRRSSFVACCHCSSFVVGRCHCRRPWSSFIAGRRRFVRSWQREHGAVAFCVVVTGKGSHTHHCTATTTPRNLVQAPTNLTNRSLQRRTEHCVLTGIEGKLLSSEHEHWLPHWFIASFTRASEHSMALHSSEQRQCTVTSMGSETKLLLALECAVIATR